MEMKRVKRVKRVMCVVILHSESMHRAHRKVQLQRDHVQSQLKVNHVASLQNIFTCLCFLFSYIGTLLIWVKMEIMIFHAIATLLGWVKSLDFGLGVIGY